MQLIADSGSTKVSWRAILDDGSLKAVETVGINPVSWKMRPLRKS